MIASIFAGIAVYAFMVYGCLTIFPEPQGLITIIHIGAVVIMFFVTFRMYKFFEYMHQQYASMFKWLIEHPIPLVKAKKVKIKGPEEDWIKEKVGK